MKQSNCNFQPNSSHLLGSGYNIGMTTLRVRFDGKVLVPQEPVNLPMDRELRAVVSEAVESTAAAVPGTAAAILRVLESGPHIPPEDVDELERMIAEGQRPPITSGIFDDLREQDS